MRRAALGRYSSGEPWGGGGYDAKMLAKELAARKLADGTPIQVIPILRKHRKDAEAEAQQQLSFVIEIWDHNIGDVANNSGAPVSEGSATAGFRTTSRIMATSLMMASSG